MKANTKNMCNGRDKVCISQRAKTRRNKYMHMKAHNDFALGLNIKYKAGTNDNTSPKI